MPIATGSRLGQYEVQDFIGQGAMGLVYRAYHSQLERTGAVKVMQAISPDADTVARFRHEAQAIAKMRHPNIVDVYDFGEFEGTPYMIVEYVPGGSLAGRMAEGRPDQATALRYLRGIAAGLDYAHDHGVVHRDVKPANVLLAADDTPVLADFGLAKLLQGSSLKSMTGVTTGTPAYMAPEQVTGSRVGPPADRYSLATIAYEMLTGVIPFDGQALMELLYAQVHRDPLPPSARNPSLGPQVDAVIMRGLAKDPAARWESCTAFVDALAVAVATPAPAVERTVVMSPLGSTVPIAIPVAAPRAAAPPPAPTVAVAMPAPAAPIAAPVPTAASPAKKRRRLWRRVAVGAAGLVVLVLVFGVCLSLVATTLTVSPSTVALGQVVDVTATHVPAHQPGSIQLHSNVRVFAFTADANGRVNVYITVPRDIELGDHTVDICWNASCHASAKLHVVAATGEVLPTPAGNVSPSAAGSPTSRPTPSPASTPTAAQSPSPTPSGETCGSTSTPVVFVPAISKLKGFNATFKCFPKGTWSVSVVQLSKPYAAGSATTPGNVVYYTQAFPTPLQVVVGVSARVYVCNTSSTCYESAAVTVGA
ncbi:MAG TPA: protein kinase [Candidatus Dormibacteraeota bacterium]|nr:protein kinase [Candidatus Dormibacteraeota bacterium]